MLIYVHLLIDFTLYILCIYIPKILRMHIICCSVFILIYQSDEMYETSIST